MDIDNSDLFLKKKILQAPPVIVFSSACAGLAGQLLLFYFILVFWPFNYFFAHSSVVYKLKLLFEFCDIVDSWSLY